MLKKTLFSLPLPQLVLFLVTYIFFINEQFCRFIYVRDTMTKYAENFLNINKLNLVKYLPTEARSQT